MTWVHRLRRYLPITAISQELIRFDTQKIQNPEISGVEYQQGTLYGYELREYLLEKWHRQCGYCGAKNTHLEVDHIVPRSTVSHRVSNLTLSCRDCNVKKTNRPVGEFLADKPEVLEKLKKQAKAPLKDAAAVNSTRYSLLERLRATGLAVETASGGLTKFNRLSDRYRKHTGWTQPVLVPVRRKCCIGSTSDLSQSKQLVTANGRLLATTSTVSPRVSPSANLLTPIKPAILLALKYQRAFTLECTAPAELFL